MTIETETKENFPLFTLLKGTKDNASKKDPKTNVAQDKGNKENNTWIPTNINNISTINNSKGSISKKNQYVNTEEKKSIKSPRVVRQDKQDKQDKTSTITESTMGIRIEFSKIHGFGAFATRPIPRGNIGRYASDTLPITLEEANQLPHHKQDYLLEIITSEGKRCHLNGEDSQDFTTKINHSWRHDNVEFDETGETYCKGITGATPSAPVELLLNYGYQYWWNKTINQTLEGNLTREQEKWLEIIIPDNKLTLNNIEKKIYTDWHNYKKTPWEVQQIPPLPNNCASVQDSKNRDTPTNREDPTDSQRQKKENIHCYPTYRRVTLNISSFGPIFDPNKGRVSRVIRMIHSLLKNHDIVYLQETHLTSQEQIKIIASYFEGCQLFGSTSDSTPAGAGVLIIIKNAVTRHYKITDTYISTSQLGKGRIVSIRLEPKKEYVKSLFSFRETCIYLKSGSGKGVSEVTPKNERKEQINELCGIPMDTHLSFLGGDINEHTNSVLNPFLEAHHMEEIEQPINTFYRMSKDKVTATRIDRWYCNISAAQAAVVIPTSKVLATVYGTIGKYQGNRLEGIEYIPSADSIDKKHLTDHVPVALYLPPPGEGGNANNKHTIPGWTLKQPLFRELAKKSWNSEFKEADSFKKCTELASHIQKSQKK
jgi:hypothetical protein